MRFILFFYVLCLAVISGFVVAGDQLTDSAFYKEYLTGRIDQLQQESIQTSDLPTEVMRSFFEGPFKDKDIAHAYRLPSSYNNLLSRFFYQSSQEVYVLTLAENRKLINTKLKYSSKGKLINVID